MSQESRPVGAVVSLWRYPVKSMLGEELNSAAVNERGLVGDRSRALVDGTDGKIVSAKNPKKWPAMFQCRAAFVEPPVEDGPLPAVRISLPHGDAVLSNQTDVHDVLSHALGRKVRLETSAPKAPQLEEYWPDMEDLAHRDAVTDEAMLERTFFDGASVHLLTTATLDALRRAHPEGRFEVRRFRPNIVVRPTAAEPEFVEQAWIGGIVSIGEKVRLRIARPCPRCVMTTLAQSDLPHDPGILRTAAKVSQAHVGVYAAVLQGGVIHCGDATRIEPT